MVVSLILSLIAIIVLGLVCLLGIAIFDALRQSQPLPCRFQQASDAELFDPTSLATVADEVSFKLIENVPSEMSLAVSATIGTGTISQIILRSNQYGTLALCNYTQEKKRSTISRGDNTATRYTDVFRSTLLITLRSADTPALPPFNVQRNPNSLLTNIFNRGMFRKVRFAEDSEFEKRVMVGTTVPESVIPLLSTPVRDTLKRNTDLTTTVNEHCIVVSVQIKARPRFRIVREGDRYDKAMSIDITEWPRFYHAALTIVDALTEAARQTPVNETDAIVPVLPNNCVNRSGESGG